MIQKIGISRFKNIEEIELKLDNINVLVGGNNAGKSSILQAIQFSISIAQTTSLAEFSRTIWKNNKLSTSLTPEQILYTPTNDIYTLGNGGSLSQKNEEAILVKFTEATSDETAEFTLRKGRNKNLLVALEGMELGQQIRSIDNPFSIYVPGLAGIAAFEQFKSEGIIRKTAAKGNANSVFRNILLILSQDQEKWSSFHTDLNDVFPEISIDISFNPKRDEHIEVYIIKGDLKLPIDTYGTGVLQTIQILSYLHLYRPKFLILDEPDSHLHPHNQKIVAEKLYDLTTELGFQIILSTHSRHLLDSFQEVAEIHWIVNGRLSDADYSFVKVLLEIGALDKGDFLNNGNIKCIVLTEDSITKPLKAILSANSFNLDETDVWAYDGCSKLDTAVVLAAFIKKHAPNARIIIHRDSDYLSEAEKDELIHKAQEAGLDIFFTNGTDIESNFIRWQHFSTIFPELDEARYNQILENAIQEHREKSLETYINHETQIALAEQYRGGPRVNSGRISITCLESFNENQLKFSVGKKVLKSLKRQTQDEIAQREIFTNSEHLLDEKLSEIKNEIWD
jgi:AAA15 family ATPase/GTPase